MFQFLHKCFSVKKILNAFRITIEEIIVLLFFFRGIERIHSPDTIFVEAFSGKPGMKVYSCYCMKYYNNKVSILIEINTLSLKNLLL